MPIANRQTYLAGLCDELAVHWPDNRCVNIICHGHSVPAGYFATPFVDSLHAYPHLLHRRIKERFPFAVLNVIVTAIGGEHSVQGAARFEEDVLCHKPDLVTIDYALNDRALAPAQAKAAWREMIEKALAHKVKVILLTPSWDVSWHEKTGEWKQLMLHAEQVRSLAAEYGVGLSDTDRRFEEYIRQGGALQDLLSHGNHPNGLGHEIIATGLARWFTAR